MKHNKTLDQVVADLANQHDVSEILLALSLSLRDQLTTFDLGGAYQKAEAIRHQARLLEKLSDRFVAQVN